MPLFFIKLRSERSTLSHTLWSTTWFTCNNLHSIDAQANLFLSRFLVKTAMNQINRVWRTGPITAPGTPWVHLRMRTTGFAPSAHAQSLRSATVYRTESGFPLCYYSLAYTHIESWSCLQSQLHAPSMRVFFNCWSQLAHWRRGTQAHMSPEDNPVGRQRRELETGRETCVRGTRDYTRDYSRFIRALNSTPAVTDRCKEHIF